MTAAFLNRLVRHSLATHFIKSAAALTLRPATREDVPQILKLEVSVFTQPWNEPTFLNMLDRKMQFWVAETADKEIGGYAVFGPYLDPKEIQLLTIAAAPGWRRQGVGHQLLRKVVSFAEESKADKITLVVRLGNYPAQKLYREFGFMPTFVYPSYYADGESGVIMERPVSNPETIKAASPLVLDGPDKTIKKTEVQGIPVNVERPKGAISVFPDKTTQFYKNDYGSIPLAKGVDGDPLDVFVGPDKGSKRVFVVNKMDDKDHSKFDEHKVLMGFRTKDEARRAAEFHLWGTDGKIQEVGLEPFKNALGLKTAAEFAPGIPERSRFVDIPKIEEPKKFEFGVHHHKAHRAGEHFDLRLGDPQTGDAYSWAMKKLPGPGKSTYAPMQPTHTVSYMDFKGEIPSGYGAGTVELARRGKAEVVSANENEVRFNVFEGRIPEQFALKRVPSQDGRMWVIHNVTPARTTKRWGELIPSDKPSMKAVKFKDLDPAKPGTAWQPKLDGAHAIGVIEAGKPLKVFSYREAKNETGLIEHTHKMPEYWKNVAPEGIRPTVVRGELVAVDKKGKPLPVNEISGLLNAGTETSREVQKQKNVRLKFMAFDVDRLEGKKVTQMPYNRTQEILDDLSKQIPGLSVMPTVYDEAGKIKLKKQIGQHKHLLTREGIVERDVATGAAIKGKDEEPHDVFIREIYSGTKPGEAGGFRFSYTETGPIVGNVGSGFDRSDRQKMLRHPERWVGRVAKVMAQQKLPSGALRMPIFHGFHESKGLQPYHEIASGGM